MAEKRERIIFEAVSDFKGVITDLSTIKRLQQDLLDATKAQTASVVESINSQKKSFEQLITANQDLAKANKAQADASILQAKTASDSAKAQQQAVRDANNEYQALKSTMTGLIGLATSIFTISQAKTFINDIIDAKSKVDNFRNTLLSMGDSVSTLDAVTAGIQRLDKNSGYTSEQLYRTATALKANSVPTSELIEKMTMLGNISALVGETKLPLIAKAYLDVRNKQVLYAQEVRQFTENGVPLYDLLAKSMDKPKQAVIEMAKAHEISFTQVEKALREATEKGGIYYGAMETKAKSLQGQVSNLSASFFYGQKNLADYFENGLQKGITVIKNFIDATIGSETAIGRTITAVKTALALWISYNTAQIALNASLKANGVQSILDLQLEAQKNLLRKTSLSATIAQIEANTALTAQEKLSLIAKEQSIVAQIADNGVKVIGTGVTTSLTGAVTALNLAIRANPFGFAVSALSLLIGAFYGLKTVMADVDVSNNQEVDSLQKLKVGFELQTRAIANTKIGTEERRREVEKMLRLYPEYVGNIDLETASTGDLWRMLDKANQQLERKIRLTAANATAEAITEKAVEVEKQRFQILQDLRKSNAQLSNQYLNDTSFMSALANAQKANTIMTSMGGTTIDLNPVNAQIKQYQLLGGQVKEVYKQIEQAVSSANQLQAQAYKEDYANLRRQLRDKEITVKEFNKLVKDLNKDQADDAEDNNQVIIKNDKKKHKARVESHALTAKQIKVIELSEMEQTIENQKKLLKAQLDADVEAVNKKYAKVKEGKVKAEEEIINLTKIYNQKIQAIEDSEQRKKDIIEERRRLSEADQVSKDLVEFEKNEKAKTAKAEKVLTEWETKQEKLLSAYDEARKKKEDAQRVYDEVNTAKTATEKYNVIVKYGRKTSDEISAINVARWKKEEELLDKQLQFYLHTYGEDSKEYKKTYEALLTLRTKILNAEGVLLEKGANEQIARYAKIYQVYVKYLSESFKEADKTFAMIQDAFKRSKDDELKALDNSYELQMKALGDNYQERIKLTEQYAKREVDILTSSANKDRIIGSLRDITNAIGNAFDNQTKIYENYITKTESNAKAGISNAGNMATSVLQTVGNIAVEILGVGQKARDRDYQSTVEINDATQKNYKRLYDERVSMAQQTHDKAIALIKEEEAQALASIEKQIEFELKKINVQTGVKVEELNKALQRELKLLEIAYAEQDKLLQEKINKDTTAEQEKLAKIQAERQRYADVSNMLQKQEYDNAKFWYDKAIEDAGDNEEKKAKLTEDYKATLLEIEKRYNDTKKKQQDYFDEQEKQAKEALEKAKKDAGDKYEQERIDKINEKKDKEIGIEKETSDKKIAVIDDAKKKILDQMDSQFIEATEKRKQQLEKELADAGTNEDLKREIQKKFDEEEAQRISGFNEQKENIIKEYNKRIEEEQQRSADNKKIIEFKYEEERNDKKKQYENERQEIIDKAEKKRSDLIAIAEQDRVIATNMAQQAKEMVIASSNAKILEADYLYQKELFEAEKAYIDQSLNLQKTRAEQQAEYNKASITSNLWTAAAKNLADGNFVGTLTGAFNALFGGSDYQNELEAQKMMAVRAINEQISANSGRQAPGKVQQRTAVQYIRDGSQVIGGDPNSQPDFLTDPQASVGHEQPIDYIMVNGRRIGVYEWVYKGNDGTGIDKYLPMIQRRYFQGSDYVERGMFPKGQDKIPAMVNEGERILPTAQNEEIGGANLSNNEMVQMVKLGKVMKQRYPTLAEMMMQSKGNLPLMNWGGGSSIKDEKLLNEVQKLNATMQKIKPTVLNVKADRDSITIEEQHNNMTTRYRNQLYRN